MFNKIEINLTKNSKNILNNKPKVLFGCLTDIQYSNSDDSTLHGSTRLYRNSINQINKAIQIWKSYEVNRKIEMKFLIQLGDIIDNKAKTADGSLPSLNKVLECLNQMECKDLLHCWGNHELYNFTRLELVQSELNTAKYLDQNLKTNSNYYTYEISSNLKLICLDFYELAVIGYSDDENNELYLKSQKYLEYMNKVSPHYLAFNGGLSEKQLNWLENQLKICRDADFKAIIVGHIPINKHAATSKYLAWHANDVLKLLWSFDDVCIAYFCGHYHIGGYHQDEHNIHHITLPGIVELKPESDSFLTGLVFDDKLVLNFN